MKDKLLINIFIPKVEQSYDLFIPINKKVGTIKQVVLNSIVELSETEITEISSLKLYDKETGESFDNNLYVKDSNIKNGTKLLLL